MTDGSATLRRARRWLGTGPLDREFYGALRGTEFSDDASAARDFVAYGMAARLSPHPFLDFLSLPADVRRAWRGQRVGPVLDHLAAHGGVLGPLRGAEDPDGARDAMLRLAHRLGAGAPGPLAPIDWTRLAGHAREARTTTVVLVAHEARPTVRAVRQVLESGPDVQVLVVDHGTAPRVALALLASLHGEDRVEVLRVDAGREGAAATAALALAAGGVVALLAPRVTVRAGWLAALREGLDAAGALAVQPVPLGPDDTVVGALRPAGAPGPGLAGHPPEDVLPLGDQPIAALDPWAVGLRTADLLALRGLADLPWDQAIADLGARLAARSAGGLRVAPDAWVTVPAQVEPRTEATGAHLWRAPGVRTGARSSGALRWSLNLPSPAGRRGDGWGDTYFANALARALRSLGEEVVTRRHGAHGAGPTGRDDVVLWLRGMRPVSPTPGAHNVLWVISHPDDVTPEDLEGHDLVCAASVVWAAETSASTGREVVPLLQASEFRPPHDRAADDAPAASEMVFVGNVDHRRDRLMVRMALEAGVPLAVYGRGWGGLPEGTWRGEHVDNRLLPALYARHGVVLADHWTDMARHGFVANRVFDAVASGARVVSDQVAGMEEVFGPDEVAVATTPGELAVAYERLRDLGPGLPRSGASLSFEDRARALHRLVRRR